MARAAVDGGVWLTLATADRSLASRPQQSIIAGYQKMKHMEDFALNGAKSAVRNHLATYPSLEAINARSTREMLQVPEEEGTYFVISGFFTSGVPHA